MASIWRPDSPAMKKITFLTNLMLLNLVYVVCCVPVITAGAATSALYAVLSAYHKDQTDEVFRPFFAAFRSNFKQSTLLWLPICLVIAIICFDALYLSANTDSGLGLLAIPIVLTVVLTVVVLTYGFPQIAMFENSTKLILRNCFHLFLLNPVKSFFMAMITLVPWIMLLFLPAVLILTLPFWLLCGFSLGAYLNVRMLSGIFGKYLQEDEQEYTDKV